MADTPSPSSLSSTHWELHRNSLLFSSLLLILCLPGAHASKTQSFLWLSFSDVGFNSLRLIACFAATYAIFTYCIEWLNEPLKILRLENDLLSSSRAKSDYLISLVTSRFEKALHDLENERLSFEQSRAAILANKDYGVTPFASDVYHELSEDERNPRQFEDQFRSKVLAIAGRTERGSPIEAIIAEGQSSIRQTALVVATAASERVHELLFRQYSDRASASALATDKLRIEVSTLNSSKISYRSLVRYSDISFIRWKTKTVVRLVVVGLVVPLSVYITALAHFGGQLNIAHLPSAFSIMNYQPITTGRHATSLKRHDVAKQL